MKRYFFIVVISIITISCRNNNKPNEDLNISKNVSNASIDSVRFFYAKILNSSPNIDCKYIKYCIIPNVGCEGCISMAEKYLMDNIDKRNDIRFILTAIASKKLIKIRYGEKIKRSNVLLDFDNTYYAGFSKYAIYPINLTLECNEIKEVKFSLE